MINVKCHYDKCHYAECHCTECHCAECHYAECRVGCVVMLFLPISSAVYAECLLSLLT